MTDHMRRLVPGARIAVRELTTVRSEPATVPDPAGLTHLQFRRYAGCPICNLHLRSFTLRHAELAAAGIREFAVFHSTPEALAPYQGSLPFDLIADPARTMYREFAVEKSIRAVLYPSTWVAAVRGLSRHLAPQNDTGDGGHIGLPADFLIAPDGVIVACKYGIHANDQWTVDQVLAAARRSVG